MSGPLCIVCGRPIRKKTGSIRFRESRPEFPDGSKVDTLGNGRWFELYLDVLPTTKAEAQRHSNFAVVSVSRGVGNTVAEVGVWDGESYEDRFFHSGDCARKQGYASARSGARFRWSG